VLALLVLLLNRHVLLMPPRRRRRRRGLGRSVGRIVRLVHAHLHACIELGVARHVRVLREGQELGVGGAQRGLAGVLVQQQLLEQVPVRVL
jgi:hypothetical protein